MSCRVFKRDMEFHFFNELIKKLKTLGVNKVIGLYIKSKKNKIVSDLYEDIGFSEQKSDSEEKIYTLNLKEYIAIKTKIKEK
jgi:predicted enzyme involved in methoxymalonyl-ACP biosynthesis